MGVKRSKLRCIHVDAHRTHARTQTHTDLGGGELHAGAAQRSRLLQIPASPPPTREAAGRSARDRNDPVAAAEEEERKWRLAGWLVRPLADSSSELSRFSCSPAWDT